MFAGLVTKISYAYIFKRWSHMLRGSPNTPVDKLTLFRYWNLPIPKEKIQATYLWMEGGVDIRLKDRVLDFAPKSPEELPDWQYDGSAVNQQDADCSDCRLVPQAIYRDPFKSGENDIIVLCETYNPDGSPTKFNQRRALVAAAEATDKHKCWFGYEQQFTLMNFEGRPFGWPQDGYPRPQGQYYCGAGADKAWGRDIIESHTLACLYAGIDLSGTNAEDMPAQWEYQLGPSPTLKLCDDVWVSRYILQRVAETYGIVISFDPKPVENWNGSSGHMSFSTEKMREDGGMKYIEKAIKKLSKNHEEHLAVYDGNKGEDNKRRLAGDPCMEKFTWDVANGKVGVRIPQSVADAGQGYFEDRRPSANCDPYQVCHAMLCTCLLEDENEKE